VIPVQMSVDDDPHVGRREVVLGQRGGHLLVDDVPVADDLSRRIADPGVDQYGACGRVLQHEAVDGRLERAAVVAHLAQVEPHDLHRLPPG